MPRAVAPRVRRAPAAAPARPAPPARSRRRLAPRFFRWAVTLTVWGLVAGFVALIFFAWDLPRPEDALAATRRPAITMVAANGALLSTSGDLYGETVRLRDLPPHVPAAFVAIEDRRFRDHMGLDVIGMIRAAVANVTAGRVVQGGSTLTQQLAKNLFLTPERSLRRKVQEALLALWLEARFTKDELLTIYLNRVYLGAGTFGIDAAARLYFGVPARRLTPGQAAVLAGLPKAPSRYNPRVNPSAAVDRAIEVLGAMVETGVLPAAAAMAEAERIHFPPAPSRDAGWFADWVRDGIGDHAPPTSDLLLRTTLDARLQAAVELRLEAMLASQGRAAGVSQGAVVAIEAASGAVRAMAGGRDYRRSPFNRATQARRQPGSAFKPFVFLAAIEAGVRPDDGVADGPINLGGWTPGNGNWRSRGEITVEDAFAHSVNTAAVRLMQRAGGARKVGAVAQRLGLPGPFPRDASIALGTAEVTLLDLVTAYAPFANGGRRVAPFGIAEMRAEGRPIAWLPPGPTPVITADAAEAMRRMMAATVARGTGRAAAVSGLAVAGKTGTTQDNRDAWFIGIAGGLVMGIWLGNDDATPMEGVAGGGLPARLFRDILETHRGRGA
ncbi:PBP1A family penicillin-binding protein [Roseomonas terrae]|uniref:peptidoglycan glycosyltransferase n=1 Tax=Neoroseomonas terrae TaxID=424799 RepID=A0ABS5ENK2_9PROT|nr:PBP1A family penicillin-binding protein [Neoroseomonas terrae]MBR0652598.1 PBP1A family penicillin-binding protein [Neoroseomonas terrae]